MEYYDRVDYETIEFNREETEEGIKIFAQVKICKSDSSGRNSDKSDVETAICLIDQEGNGSFIQCGTVIPEDFFKKEKSLKTLDVPETVKTILPRALKGCSNLSKIIFHGNNLSTIGMFAFEKTDNLITIKFPNSLRKISKGAFKGSGLYTLDLSNCINVKITINAFMDCKSLTKVYLPDKFRSDNGYDFIKNNGLSRKGTISVEYTSPKKENNTSVTTKQFAKIARVVSRKSPSNDGLENEVRRIGAAKAAIDKAVKNKKPERS